MKNKPGKFGKYHALVYVFFCTIINTIAQFFLKSASSAFVFDMSMFFNPGLIIGGILYMLSMVIYIYALRLGELSTLAPILSLQYVFVNAASAYFLHEIILPLQVLGLFLILTGVAFIGKEAKA